MKKRILLFVGAGAFALVVGVVSIWLYIGRTGTSDLENWLGRQVAGILQNHITPEVHFDNIDYQAPRTVVIDNLSMTVQGRPIVQIAWAKLELGEIPQRGKPILIQDIQLNSPKFQFITTGQGDLIGWSHFVKTEAIKDPNRVPAGQRLSDVLVLKHVGIHEGEVIYEGESDGRDRMTLPGINLKLDTPHDQNDPAWHVISGQLKRDPLVDLQINGRLNLDTGLLEIAKLQLAASLSERQYGTLPPALQNFLRRHEVQGALNASAKGNLPLGNPAEFAGTVNADLKDARVRYGGMAMPVKDLHVDATLPRGGVNLAVNGVNLAGEEQSFFSVDSITARLAGIPAPGEPLVIERIHVKEPHVVFASRPGGGLKGWSQLAELGQDKNSQPPKQKDESKTNALQAIRLQEFKIDGGAVTYQSAHGEPITMDGIQVALSSTPREQSPEMLDLAGNIQAGPLVKADLRGELNTRTAALNLNKFEAGIEIRPGVYDQLPPRARDWVSRHSFEGKLVASAQGQIPLQDPSQIQFNATAELTSARMQQNGVTIPIDEARVQFMMPQRRMEAIIGGVQLISDDQTFFALKRMTAAFTMPDNGPMVLEEMLLEQPAAKLISSPAGGLVGWNRLGLGSDAGPPTRPASEKRAEHSSMVVKSVKVGGASIAYAPNPVVEPVQIDGIDLTFNGIPDQKDLLQVTAKVADKLIQAQLAGRLNSATRVLQVEQLEATATINEDQSNVPQAVQPMLLPYRFAGKLTLNAKGTVPLDAIDQAKGQVQAELASASMAYKGLQIPIGQGRLEATLPDGPFSMSVGDLSISAGQTPIAKARTVALQGRLPGRGQPMKLDLLRMEQPAVNLVRMPQGGLVGWSEFSEPSGPAGQTTAQGSPAQRPPPAWLKKFNLDRIEIAGAEVRYEGPETNGPVIVQGLDANVRTGKADNALTFSGQVRQPDLMAVDFEGRYDAQRSSLSFSQFNARADIDDARLAKLPEATRESLQRHQIQGSFAANWQGVIPLGSAAKPKGRFELNVNNARLVYADSVFPVGAMKVQGELPNGPVGVNAQKVAIRAGDMDIFSANSVDLRIDRLASDQGPMQISQLVLNSPRVLLVSQKDGFAGWSRLTGSTKGNEAKKGNEDKQAAEQPGPVIKRLEVQEGELVYAPAPGQAIMALPGINLRSEMEPAPNTNWSSVVGQIKRGPFLDVDLRGRFNATARLLDLETLRLRAEVNDKQMQSLPPSIQAMVRDHEVRGVFSVEAQGHIPFKDPEQLQGRMTATVRDGHFTYKATNWPIQQLDLTAEANKGNITAQANAALLGGSLKADGRASLPQGGGFEVNWQASKLELENMLRAMGEQPSRYAGLIDSKGQARGKLGNLPQTLAGSGELLINNGKLLHLPVIENVVVMLLTAPLLGRELETRDDQARIIWDFRPDSIQVNKMALVSRLVALEGKGQVYYDGRLDARFNAQPRELQATKVLPKGLPGGIDRVLGGIDKMGSAVQDIGTLGGKIVTYRVEGTLDQPRVVPMPLGLSGK